MMMGSANYVELFVRDNAIDLRSAETVAVETLQHKIDKKEPRFYLFKDAQANTFFIYSCPEASKPMQRIVYSTAKQNVISEAVTTGLEITKKMEIREGSEVSPAELADALRAPTEAELNAPTEAVPAVPRIDSANPMFSLLADVSRKPAGPNPLLKRIVMPPRGAYM
jgi:hypothetical protein